MVHLQGFEPGTHWLRVSCSTNWAKGAKRRDAQRFKNGTRKKGSVPEGKRYKERTKETEQIGSSNETKHKLWTEKYSSSPRSISIGQLNTLLCLHLRPIKLVVCKWPYSIKWMGYLILKHVSRLDAFSVYHSRTRLLSYAPGGTTDAPEVRPTRSSRTKVSPSQISNAHDR